MFLSALIFYFTLRNESDRQAFFDNFHLLNAFLLPVFLSALVTNVWLVLFATFVVLFKAFRKVKLIDDYLKNLMNAAGSRSVLGGLTVPIFSVLYWPLVLIFNT